MIDTKILEKLYPNFSCAFRTSMGTQTEEVPCFIQSCQIYNYFKKNSQFCEDKKLYLMLLKEKNASIFERAERNIKFLEQTTELNREQLFIIYQTLNALIEITSSQISDKNDLEKGLFYQKLLIEKLLKILNGIKVRKEKK